MVAVFQFEQALRWVQPSWLAWRVYETGIHPSGWNDDWIDWIKRMESDGKKITKEAIECHLEEVMKPKYEYILKHGKQSTRRWPGAPAKSQLRKKGAGGRAIGVGIAIFAVLSAADASANTAQLVQDYEEFLKFMKAGNLEMGSASAAAVGFQLGLTINAPSWLQLWAESELYDALVEY